MIVEQKLLKAENLIKGLLNEKSWWSQSLKDFDS